MIKSGNNYIFQIIFIFFFLVNCFRGLQLYTGDTCVGPSCIVDDSVLFSTIDNSPSHVVLFISGTLLLDQPRIINQTIHIIGTNNANISANPLSNQSTISISFTSSFTLDSLNIEVPIIISGVTKLILSKKYSGRGGIKSISKDYQCYGECLGDFDIYNRNIRIQNSIFNVTYSTAITIGDGIKKLFVDQLSIQNNTFVEFPSPPSLNFTLILTVDDINAMYIKNKVIINQFLLEYNKFLDGLIIVNGGDIVRPNVTINYWLPQYYIQSNTNNTKTFFPSILNVENDDDFLIDIIKNNSLCAPSFFAEINSFPSNASITGGGGDYLLINPSLVNNSTRPYDDSKIICVICNSSDILNISLANNCDILFDSFDALRRATEYDWLPTNLNVTHFDVLKIFGYCHFCNYRIPFRNIQGPGSMISSCSPGASSSPNPPSLQPIFRFIINGDDPTENTNINITNVKFIALDSFNRGVPIQEGEAIVFESRNSNCELFNTAYCVNLTINNCNFYGFDNAIYMYLSQQCSSTLITNSIFQFNSVSVKYYENEEDPLANFTCSLINPSFIFDNNSIIAGGGIYISGKKWIDPLTVTPQDEKKKHDSSHPHSQTSRRSDKRGRGNLKRTTLLSDLQASIIPQYNFRISNNQINTTSVIFICHSLSGFVFDSNQVFLDTSGSELVISSDCQTVSIQENNITNINLDSDSLAIIDLSGNGQMITDNFLDGRISIITNPAPVDQGFHLTHSGSGSYFIFRNSISKNTIIVTPESKREMGHFDSDFFSSYTIKDICQQYCAQLTNKCWTNLLKNGEFFDEYKYFRNGNNNPCSLNISSPDTLGCHSCIFNVINKNDSFSFGTKVVHSDNHLLEKCDLTNFIFTRDANSQCRNVTSENVFFTSNYISPSCRNVYHDLVSTLDGTSLSMIIDAPTRRTFLDQSGSLLHCPHHKFRDDNLLSNPPRCCQKKKKIKQHHHDDDDDDDEDDDDDDNWESNHHHHHENKKQEIVDNNKPKKTLEKTANVGKIMGEIFSKETIQMPIQSNLEEQGEETSSFNPVPSSPPSSLNKNSPDFASILNANNKPKKKHPGINLHRIKQNTYLNGMKKMNDSIKKSEILEMKKEDKEISENSPIQKEIEKQIIPVQDDNIFGIRNPVVKESILDDLNEIKKNIEILKKENDKETSLNESIEPIKNFAENEKMGKNQQIVITMESPVSIESIPLIPSSSQQPQQQQQQQQNKPITKLSEELQQSIIEKLNGQNSNKKSDTTDLFKNYRNR